MLNNAVFVDVYLYVYIYICVKCVCMHAYKWVCINAYAGQLRQYI
jgi:hypothetical protein